MRRAIVRLVAAEGRYAGHASSHPWRSRLAIPGQTRSGAPSLRRSTGNVESLSYEQTKELQQLLKRRGLEVGEIDGKLGAGTRKAVKEMQVKFGLPADSYPTAELLNALRGRNQSSLE